MDPKTGGPAQAIRYLFPHFHNYESSHEVVCLDGMDENTFDDLNLRIIPLGKSVSLWQYNKQLYPWLIVNLCNYDFVIIHGLWLYHSYAVTKAITQLKKDPQNSIPKVFVMYHGMLDPWFQKSKTRIFKAIRNWFYWKFIEHKVIAQADGVLFTCEEEMRLARTTFLPYNPINEFNVGYGIESPPIYEPLMSEIFYQICPSVKGKNYFLYLSRIHPKKGIDLLIKAYLLLLKNSTFKDMLPDLVIAGPGLESKYGKSILNSIAEDTELNKIVHVTGMLTGNAKWGAIYGSDAFILPSHQENFGIAVVEAMACSKPVLISDQVNIWKEIFDGGGGIIGKNNLAGVVDMLQRWMSLNDFQKRQMSFNADKVFKEKFTVEKAAKNIIDVFLEVHES
jgi:glycosyltransferase involved in cell wall biosynthesis